MAKAALGPRATPHGFEKAAAVPTPSEDPEAPCKPSADETMEPPPASVDTVHTEGGGDEGDGEIAEDVGDCAGFVEGEGEGDMTDAEEDCVGETDGVREGEGDDEGGLDADLVEDGDAPVHRSPYESWQPAPQ